MVLRCAARPAELDADAADRAAHLPARRRPTRCACAGCAAACCGCTAGAAPRGRRAGRRGRGRAGQQRPAAGRGAARGGPRAGPTRWPRCPPQETAPLRRVGALLAPGRRRRSADGRERRGGAVAGLAGHRAGSAVERGQRPRRPGRGGRRPRPRRRARAVRRRRPAHRPAARRRRRRLRRLPRRPAAAGRHAGRPGPAGRGGRAAHRARRARPRVGRGRGARACRRAAGPTCGCAAACWATSGWSTWSPGIATPEEHTVSRAAPLLAEERRLFYVACTRARQTLLVSAVAGEDEQPSRFLDELDPMPADQADRPVHRPRRSLVLAELVGELRRAVCEPDVGETVRQRAGRPRAGRRAARPAAQLARLADAGVPGAHPDDWYGLAPLSTDGAAARPGESRCRCPRRTWRRSSVARCAGCWSGTAAASRARWPRSPARWCTRWCRPARPARTEPSWRGRCARPGRGWTPGHPGSAAASSAGCAACWPRSTAGCGPAGPRGCGWSPWSSRCGWTCPARTGAVRRGCRRLQLRGRVDRLEVDADGRPVVVDVKTGKAALSARAAAEHPQLAVYQLAAALGAFGRLLRPGAAARAVPGWSTWPTRRPVGR